VLADWGADVVKIEHPVTGDAQRGLVKVLGAAATVPGSSFAPIMEAPNRGKRSVGLALDNPEARPLLDELIRRSDVFLTNYLPSSRSKLSIDVDDVRRVNPDIIYVVGNGFGSDGPDRDAGAYDATAFWARGGSADGLTSPDAAHTPFMPAGAYGDNIGGITIAGGVAAALYGRQATGEPVGARRLAPRGRRLGNPIQREHGDADGRPAAEDRAPNPGSWQPTHRRLPDIGRKVRPVIDAAADPLLAGVLLVDGPARSR
jgi:crotonobetainyl-CoA:carnitine CoA-transferase CaiB-like acyl-CoA transferase